VASALFVWGSLNVASPCMFGTWLSLWFGLHHLNIATCASKPTIRSRGHTTSERAFLCIPCDAGVLGDFEQEKHDEINFHLPWWSLTVSMHRRPCGLSRCKGTQVTSFRDIPYLYFVGVSHAIWHSLLNQWNSKAFYLLKIKEQTDCDRSQKLNRGQFCDLQSSIATYIKLM
jgi:hypothetical protein